MKIPAAFVASGLALLMCGSSPAFQVLPAPGAAPLWPPPTNPLTDIDVSTFIVTPADSDDYPLEGEPLNFTAYIRNRGLVPVYDVSVDFYLLDLVCLFRSNPELILGVARRPTRQ